MPLKAILLVGPVIVILVCAFTVRDVLGWILLAVSAALVIVIAFFAGVRMAVDSTGVTIRFFPFWGKRLRWHEIRQIGVEEVRPLDDFGGWGLKGSARKNGLLLSAGDDRVVTLTLVDGRRYLVGAGDESFRVLEELVERRSRPGDEERSAR